MKKTFTAADLLRVAGLAGFLMLILQFAGCAFSDYGNRVNDERDALMRLERMREDYQTRYVIVLNSLERYIGDPKLEKERDGIQKKILDLDFKIKEQRKVFDQSVDEWSQKIAQDKLQKEINDKEEQSSASKQDGEWDSR